MDFLFNSSESKLFGLTLFIAVLVFQIAFVFVQWNFNKRADYLFYIAFMFVTGLFGLSLYESQLTFSPLNKISKEWFISGRYMLPLLSGLLYYRFARSFLDLPERRPRLNKQVKRLELGLIIYQVISVLFILDLLPKNAWKTVFEIASILTILASAFIITSFLRGSSVLEKYAMLAASFLVVGSVLDVILGLRNQAGLWIPCDQHLPLLICVFGEILTFTTGLTHKTKLLEISHLNAENELLTKRHEVHQSHNELLELKNNIARDLHDDMGARLSLINIMLQQYSISTTSSIKDNLIDKCGLVIKQSISYLREMMNEIHGTPILNEGYFNSVNSLVNSIESTNEIRFHLLLDNLNDFDNPKLEYHLYKITQELINNTLKYAHASNIDISISLNKSNLTFDYEDDGIGFNLLSHPEGSGLLNIQDRVQMLLGNFHFESQESCGFKCKIDLLTNNLSRD